MCVQQMYCYAGEEQQGVGAEESEVAVRAVGDGDHRAVSFRSLRFGIRDLEGRPKPCPFWPPLMLICSG